MVASKFLMPRKCNFSVPLMAHGTGSPGQVQLMPSLHLDGKGHRLTGHGPDFVTWAPTEFFSKPRVRLRGSRYQK
eukprot:1175919-Prorocentrum_minimum.AAC.3